MTTRTHDSKQATDIKRKKVITYLYVSNLHEAHKVTVTETRTLYKQERKLLVLKRSTYTVHDM